MYKTTLTLSIALFVCLSVFGQKSYESGMNKAFQLWKENKTDEAVALFERISNVESENWIPNYYVANVLIAQSFQDTSANIRNERLKKAINFIDKAHKLSPNNSEITTLEGMLYTGYVAMDPATYGMQYSAKIMGLHEKAIAINPDNPRALANAIEFEMGAARFFNQDLAPLCEKLQSILPKFDDQESEVPFYPSFGKERVIQIIESCK